PIILLPVAAMNQLTTAQVEAILLHELSHIRRYDYLLNFIVSVIYTLLYFNPLVKSFMQTIEAEREACCDETVLQFGYDKVGYASALLHLEKVSGRHNALALAAAGRQNLLSRIEKIVGMEKKKTFRLVQIVPLVMAMFCVLLFNSVLIIKDAKSGDVMTYASNLVVLTPWQLNEENKKSDNHFVQEKPAHFTAKVSMKAVPATDQVKIEIFNVDLQPKPEQPVAVANEHIIPVAFDEVDGSLTTEQKETVKSTVEATKKVASTLQWKEIEKSIGDAMDCHEKAMAKQEYLEELNKVSWSTIEQNLKANYDKFNWEAIQLDVNKAMVQVQIDSLQTVYTKALSELEKAEKNLKIKSKCSATPLPDASVEHLQMAKEALSKNLELLKAASRPKKVVSL
ncbi:MAG TPA: M56 family metallopeptidase, partial [Flavisolibacter sp.]|nr:M56 family metallopeptidase [Flavisolibacter sp.]